MLAAVVLEGVLLLVALVALVLRERDKDKARATERDQYLAQFADLCQRIQAPAVAVTDHSLKDAPVSLPAVGFDDDADHWAATESKEDMADRMMRDELEAAKLAAARNGSK